MAARKTLSHLQRTKAKIRTSMLLTRLQNNALGKLSTPMTGDQIRCAEILIRKTMPDLKSIEGTLDVDGEIIISWQK